jgi:uncharacterized membrane protein YkoI
MTNKSKRIAITAAAIAVLGAGAGGAAYAAGGGDDDVVTGPDADRAAAAALAATGGGKANSVERDSENGAVWEVEVTKTDGSTVDVRLDKDLGVVVIEGDSESADDGDGEG